MRSGTKSSSLWLLGTLLTSSVHTAPICFSSSEIAPLVPSLFGFKDIQEVINLKNLKAEGGHWKEYKWKSPNNSIAVRHTVCTSDSCLQSLGKEQKFIALMKGFAPKDSTPVLTACVRVEQNFFFFYDSYGPSVAMLLQSGEYIKRRARYHLYSQLSTFFGKLDDHNIVYNNFSLDNVRLLQKSGHKVHVTDFSKSYVYHGSCRGDKDQIWYPSEFVNAKNQKVCSQIIQVLTMIAVIEHQNFYPTFHQHYQGDVVSRLTHYCSTPQGDKKLQNFICGYLQSNSISYDDIMRMRHSLESLNPSKKKKKHNVYQ